MSQRSLFDCGVSKKRKAEEESSALTSETCQSPAAKKPKSDSAPGSASSKSRVFQESWLKQFDWLEYDASSKRMFCKTCRAANIHSAFTSEGAG